MEPVVGQFNATDPEGEAITYSLINGGVDNHYFSLSSNGLLTLNGSLDYETDLSDSFRTLPQVALNTNPGFEDGLTGWGVGGDGTLSEVNASNLVQAGSKSVDWKYRSSGGYARLTGSYVQLLAGRSYSFSMDFRGVMEHRCILAINLNSIARVECHMVILLLPISEIIGSG